MKSVSILGLLLSALVGHGQAVSAPRILVPDLAPASVLGEKDFTEFKALRAKLDDDAAMSLADEQRLFVLTTKAVTDNESKAGFKNAPGAVHPWSWGLYLLGSAAFNYGSSLYDAKREAEALTALDVGLAAAEKCVTTKSNDPSFQVIPCRFMKGSLTSKIASINGILSALSKAKGVLDEWTSAADGDVDLVMSKTHTLKASANYALGLFYRLVPDLWLVNMIFDVRGNLDESVRRHQLSTKIQPENACYLYGEYTALVCRGQKRSRSEDTSLAEKLSARVASMKAESTLLARCKISVKKISEQPKTACGFTGAKQVNEDEANKIGK